MKFDNVDIQQFRNLADLNNFIETNIHSFEERQEIIHLLVKFRDKATDVEEKQKIQWELDFMFFDLKGNHIFPFSFTQGAEPNEQKIYPDINELILEQFEYLIKRTSEIQSPILLARNNHILWKSPKGIKNKKYAIEAIKNYFQSIDIYCQLAADSEHYSIQHKIGKLFEHVVCLCGEVNSQLEELRTIKNKLLFDTPSITFYTKHGIINDMLEYPKIFKSKDFERVLSIFDSEINKDKSRHDDFALVNYHLPTALKVAQKTNSDVKKWHNEIGLAYLRLAESEKDEERYWLKINDYASSIDAFKLAANTPKVEEVTRLYWELKPKIKLNDVKFLGDPESNELYSILQKSIESSANEFLMRSPDSIYSQIANGYFFPNANEIIRQSKEQNIFSRNFCSVIYFDKNKNITKESAKSNYDEEVHRTYGFHINLSTLAFLQIVFTNGIKSGHLTVDNFFKFLIDKTWIGKPYYTTSLSGEQMHVNLIMLLVPPITEYFNHIQAWASTKYYTPNFALCIDSLTLKVESLMRNLCQRLNVPTSVNRTKGMQEIYLYDVFDNEVVRKHFNDDDMLFFDFLFSTDGLNLRNNVAHGFYLPNDYTNDKMLLLVSALLRIAKFDYGISQVK